MQSTNAMQASHVPQLDICPIDFYVKLLSPTQVLATSLNG
jgi:hypothetical protein